MRRSPAGWPPSAGSRRGGAWPREGTGVTLAVFLPNWIGDAVMATPALRALRQHFAGARLVGVLKPYVAGVLEGAPWLDELVFLDSRGPWSRRWPAAAWALRRRH